MSSIFRMLLQQGSAPGRFLAGSRCNFSSTSWCLNKPAVTTETAEKKSNNSLHILQDGRNHKVDKLEKIFLVWTGKYKRVEDVPETVSQEAMEKARNKARIKISNYMIVGTVLACAIFVYSGKQAAKRGETVQKMNLDWHQEVNKTPEPATK